ncbi:class I SAM-dependent methyltransferase [Ruegeria arenilitoris]|uniref:class I SAM-dependent methyltransferase n=1 Tax=Ruegeria arenilitoris TaxID=1173585 RepID=UPI001C2CB228
MERGTYDRMSRNEDVHWWFAGRRDVIRATIDRLISLPENARILEAGCGTGGNLEMLMGLGELDAFEYDAEARAIAAEKSCLEIAYGALPNDIPNQDKKYDLIALFDVLEHIEDDRATLEGLSGYLAGDARLFVTVPALPWMWSSHDEMHHHFRRYTKNSLKEVSERAGLEVEYSFYFNSLLFPIAVGLRRFKALFHKETADDAMPSDWVNKILYRVFSTERHFVGRFHAPIGLSVCAILKRKQAG